MYLTKLVGLPYSSINFIKSFPLYPKYYLIAVFLLLFLLVFVVMSKLNYVIIFYTVFAMSFFLSLLMKTLPWSGIISWETFQFSGTFFSSEEREAGCLEKAVLGN